MCQPMTAERIKLTLSDAAKLNILDSHTLLLNDLLAVRPAGEEPLVGQLALPRARDHLVTAHLLVTHVPVVVELLAVEVCLVG